MDAPKNALPESSYIRPWHFLQARTVCIRQAFPTKRRKILLALWNDYTIIEIVGVAAQGCEHVDQHE